ncbi:MAG: multicopper oxidase domain-containing protein [Chthoniobacterales bacterium]
MMKLQTFLLAAAASLSLWSICSAIEPKGPTPPRAPFQVPFQKLPVLVPTSTDATTDYYDVTMQVGQKEILSGRLTTIWGYNGLYPGPTIMATRGRTVVVRQLNNLQESMSVHLHGGHTPSESDGLPYDLIGPGGMKTYTYPNNQSGATLWYHDHAIDTTGRHAYMGLSGMYLIRDPAEDSLGLPSGKSDVALMIQDRLLNFDGSLNYPLDDTAISNGVFGNTLLVNGVMQPYFQVARRKMRFRIVNGSNARNYTLALSTGDPLLQIATDQGLLTAPVSRSSIVVSPGERIEVVIDFANYALGSNLILKNLDTANPVISDLMRFDVVRDEVDQSVVPKELAPATNKLAAKKGAPSVNRTFTLEPGTINGRPVWTVNGALYDPQRVDAMPQLNATEIWTFQNNSGQAHPMHIHDIHWQILDVNGVAPSPGDAGPKDTFLVPRRVAGVPGTVRVMGTFTDNVGDYVSHCHNLEHEDHAMMFNFQVQP